MVSLHEFEVSPPAADREMGNEIGESGQEIPNYELKDIKRLSRAEGSHTITFRTA